MLQTLEKVHPKLSKDLSESFDLCQINHCTLAAYEKRGFWAPTSFDHLVGAGNEIGWQGKTDCSGGSEID
jgi:hypothetical protein